MAQFINQHSFVLGAAALFAGVAVFLLHDGLTRRDAAALVVLAASILVAWGSVRPEATTLRDAAQVEAALRAGGPTLVEFYSEY